MAPVGVTGTHARLTAVTLQLENPSPGGDPPVGFEATCAAPDSPDAEIAVTNVTLNGEDASNSTGARAVARGGDGAACNATVQLNTTVIHRVETALEAHGEPGTGADAIDGVARIRPQYSAFDPSRTASTPPADLDTSSTGGNVFADPHFVPDVFGSFYMYWDSPLIDHGDPAEPEPWQQDFIGVIHGRRDIGRYEYRFEPPGVRIDASSLRIAPERFVRLTAGAYDNDPGDAVSVRWQLSDGTTSTDRELFRDYGRVGRFTERVTAVDSTGLTAQDSITITVAKQRVTGLTMDPRAFRATRRPMKGGVTRTTIGYALAVPGRIRFRVERAAGLRAGHRRRWVRVPGRLSRPAEAGHAALGWGGWIGGRRLRPAVYRLVAIAGSGPPRRARFRIIRQPAQYR
jgi:PKD domain-containing protein